MAQQALLAILPTPSGLGIILASAATVNNTIGYYNIIYNLKYVLYFM